MKKYLKIFLILFVLSSSLAGCSKAIEKNEIETSKVKTSEESSDLVKEDSKELVSKDVKTETDLDQKSMRTLQNVADVVIDLNDVEITETKDFEFEILEPNSKEGLELLKTNNIEVNKKPFKLDFPGDEYMNTMSNDDYYVILFENKYANFGTKVNIAKVNLETNEQEIFYSYDNPEQLAFLSELQVTKDYFFWEEFYPEGNWEIKRMDLKDRSIKVIRNSESTELKDADPALAASEKYLCWFEMELGTESVNNSKVMCYDIYKDSIYSVEDNIYLTSPYNRISIEDDLISYLVKIDNQYIIKRLNLKTKTSEALILPNNILTVDSVKTTEELTTWQNYRKKFTFVYDHKNNSLTKFSGYLKFTNHEPIEFDPFINSVIDNNIIWGCDAYDIYDIDGVKMDSEDKDSFKSDIYFCDLENRKIVGLVDNQSSKTCLYYSDLKSADSQIPIRDEKEDSIIIVGKINANENLADKKLRDDVEKEIREKLADNEMFQMMVESEGVEEGELDIQRRVDREIKRREKDK